MQKELHIKKKQNMLFVLMFILSLVFLNGCSKANIEMQEIRMLIEGGPNNASCIIEVFSDGKIEVTSGPLSLKSFDDVLDSEEYFSNEVQYKSKMLSKSESDVIDVLISNVKAKCDPTIDGDFGDDPITVSAIVDGVMYHAEYYDDPSNENRDLTLLARELVAISPRVKGPRIWDLIE